jgi:thiosulfate/3-mercaptopyruvate sulfurtransferase
MEFQTLITAEKALEHVDDANWAFVDCRFSLTDSEQGFRDYQVRHIRGAVYAHLNKDLSGPIIPGATGRHPLPEEKAIAQTLSRLGIDSQTQVVAYDEAGGNMAASRLWWLLHWAGHSAAAVLDGGLKEWLRLGYPTASGIEERPKKTFVPHFKREMVVDAGKIMALREDPSYVMIDARANDRYRGMNETIDPVPGHIPGAQNAPFLENLEPEGRFKPGTELKKRFDSISSLPADKTIMYCGSGVTAAHNALAFAIAGNGMPLLYVGSWSDWITDPARPVAVGEEMDRPRDFRG